MHIGLERHLPGRLAITTILILLMGVPLLAMGGCIGQHARQRVLDPAIDAADDGVEQDALIGVGTVEGELDRVQAQNTVDEFFRSLRDDDRREFALVYPVLWPDVRGYAELGIRRRVQLGEIGPTLADSWYERLNRFEAALDLFVSR